MQDGRHNILICKFVQIFIKSLNQSTMNKSSQDIKEVRKIYLQAKVIVTQLVHGMRIKIIDKSKQSLKVYQSTYNNENLIETAKSIFGDVQTTYAYIAQNIQNDKIVYLKTHHTLHVNYILKVGQIEKAREIEFPLQKLEKGFEQLILKEEYQSKIKDLQQSFYKSNEKIFQLQDQVKDLKAKQAQYLFQIESLNLKIEKQHKSQLTLKEKVKYLQQQAQKTKKQNQTLRHIILLEKKAFKSQLQLQQRLNKGDFQPLTEQKQDQTEPLNPHHYHAAPSHHQLVLIKRVNNTQLGQDSKKFKITFMGATNSGKTAVIQRFVHQNWIGDQHKPTIGIDFLSIAGQLHGQKFRLQVWDTAGQERFRSLVPSYLKDSAAVVLVFDLTDPSSFQQMQTAWLPLANENATVNTNKFLIGTKADISKNIHAFAEKNNFNFRIVSAKNNVGIQQLFSMIASSLLHQ